MSSEVIFVKKIYSAFISSAFTSLEDERNSVINVLLDFRILPIGMEHFTVSTSGEFSDIEELIDDSDFLIMLMGARYGSCDENGVSWTEREYKYALQKEKPIIVIICDELIKNIEKDKSELTEDELKQVDFCNRINFARRVSDKLDIQTIISQFLHTYNFAKCIGWSRIENINLSEKKIKEWQDAHRAFDISGNWYHVHLSEYDDTYIRVGTIKIEQDFTPDNYTTFIAQGNNYDVLYYDTQNEAIIEDKMKSSHFTAEYTMKENGEIFGIFNAKRAFKSTFGTSEVAKGTNRGIHDFTIYISEIDKETTSFDGEYHDEAPSLKHGRIFVFRDIKERNEFLMQNRSNVIESR